MSDDLETVCPSGRVMARRRSLTDQARREEIREEEEGRGSLAALSFRLRRRGRWRQLENRTQKFPGSSVLGLCTDGDEKALKVVTTNPVRHV